MKKLLSSFVILIYIFCAPGCSPKSLWEQANENKDILRISTWIPAHHLSTEEGLNSAIDWCKKTGITRVFIGVYDEGSEGELAGREILERAGRALKRLELMLQAWSSQSGSGNYPHRAQWPHVITAGKRVKSFRISLNTQRPYLI